MSESRLYSQTMDGGDVTPWGYYKFPQNWQNENIVSKKEANDVIYSNGKVGESKTNFINAWDNQKNASYVTRHEENGISRSWDFGGGNT